MLILNFVKTEILLLTIDLDTDNYLIDIQVFQLVNTLYQQGQNYQGKHE